MTTIDKIRAEIKKRRLHFNKEAEKYQALNNGYSQNCYGARDALRDLENFLDTLEEPVSEEDEDMLNSCISSIEEAKENRYAYKETDGDTSYDHEIAWLKLLRNRVGKEFLQPHWKPSEEQMKALLRVVDKARELHYSSNSGYDEYDVLRLLYKQLKEL